jgi:hypothetical protein
MDAEDEALPPQPLPSGQLQPPVRRPPTAVGADDAELRWEDVSHLFPECRLVATRHADQCQAAFVCQSTLSGKVCQIRVLLRSAWAADSITAWLSYAAAVQPLDLPTGPVVTHLGQRDRFAFVGQVWLPNTILDDRLRRGGMAKAPLHALVQSLLQTFALLHQAGVVHGRLTTRSIGCRAIRIDLDDLLEPPAPAPAGAVEPPAPSVEDDLYQLAAIFYTAATARQWLGPGTAREFLDRSAAEGPLAEAILRMLTREPGERYPTASAFRRGIEQPVTSTIFRRVLASLARH